MPAKPLVKEMFNVRIKVFGDGAALEPVPLIVH
jgi:hypothetical protein